MIFQAHPHWTYENYAIFLAALPTLLQQISVQTKPGSSLKAGKDLSWISEYLFKSIAFKACFLL